MKIKCLKRLKKLYGEQIRAMKTGISSCLFSLFPQISFRLHIPCTFLLGIFKAQLELLILVGDNALIYAFDTFVLQYILIANCTQETWTKQTEMIV